MPKQSLKDKTAKGLFWGGLSNGLQQLLNLLFGIVLANLLTQEDYGMVGMIAIFSAIAATLQEGGFIAALTNKKNASHKDYNAVFWFSTLCGSTVYVLLFFASPLIADFYKEPQLVSLARLSFVGFLISSLNVAPRAYLFKHLKVKENAIISFVSLIASGTVGIILAFNGCAYWGIVWQNIVFVSMVTLLSFYLAHWRPTLSINLHPIREMIGFSSKIIITNLFNVINQNLFPVILGKCYTHRDVGNFTQANKWNSMGYLTIAGMINGVAQPVLNNVSDDTARQLAVFRKLLRFTAFVAFPAMLGLSLVSRELILITITEKWIESAEILRLLCVWGAFVPIGTLFINLLLSRGHSSIYMWGTIGLCLMQILSAYVLHSYGWEYMLYAFVGIHILWLLVWWWFVKGEIGLTLWQCLKDVVPYLLLALACCWTAYTLTKSIENIYLLFVAKVVVTTVLYILCLWGAGSVIFRESMDFLLKRKRYE